MVVCGVCSKDAFVCDVCKCGLFMDDLLHVEREFVRLHLLRRTFCVHVCSELSLLRGNSLRLCLLCLFCLKEKRYFGGKNRFEGVSPLSAERSPRSTE